MGIFSKKEPVLCCICGRDIKKVYPEIHYAKDGAICHECYISAGFPASISVSLVTVALLKEQISNSDGLTITKRYKQGGGKEPEVNIQATSNSVAHCPKCGSTSISADKKGFGVGKAVVGAAVAGPIGLIAGNMGASKVRITCLNCGHQWIAGKS